MVVPDPGVMEHVDERPRRVVDIRIEVGLVGCDRGHVRQLAFEDVVAGEDHTRAGGHQRHENQQCDHGHAHDP